jgi:MFS family permease
MLSFFGRFVPSRNLLHIHNIRWLVLTRFFADLFFYSTTIVIFQQQRGLNFTEIFLNESILSAAILIADIPTSIWADRFGYRSMIIVGCVLSLFGMITYLFAYGFWLFALSSVIGGLAMACSSGCESALLYSSIPLEDRDMRGSEAFALIGMATSAGMFLGLFTGSFIGAYSPALAVAASIVPIIFSLFAAFRLHKQERSTMTVETKAWEQVYKILRVSLHTIRSQPELVLLSIFSALAFALVNAIFWYNQPYFARAGIQVALFGPLMAGAMTLKMLLVQRIPSLQRWLGTRALLALSCLLPGIAYILLAFTHALVATVLLVACIVAFSGWRHPIVDNELNKRIPDESRATTLSALSLIGSLAAIALNPLIGYAGDVGLNITGIGLRLGMIGLCIMVPLMV